MKDSISNHLSNEFTLKAEVEQKEDRTFSEKNRHLYFNPNNPPEKIGDRRLDEKHNEPKFL